jgi:hypothetical protein
MRKSSFAAGLRQFGLQDDGTFWEGGIAIVTAIFCVKAAFGRIRPPDSFRPPLSGVVTRWANQLNNALVNQSSAMI